MKLSNFIIKYIYEKNTLKKTKNYLDLLFPLIFCRICMKRISLMCAIEKENAKKIFLLNNH